MCRSTELRTRATDTSGKDDGKANSRRGGYMSIIKSVMTDILLIVYTLGFVFFRIGELVPLISTYPDQCLAALIGTVGLSRLLRSPAMRRLIHVTSILTLIYLFDSYIPKGLPPMDGPASQQVKTVLITGGNSGVGFETARALAVNYGKEVILGCRSEAKCSTAADMINVEVAKSGSGGKAKSMLIDLADFASVASLVKQLPKNGIKNIDVLFNNAGYAPGADIPVNEYGLDPAFTSMHLSHYLLTELLLKSNPSLRVVNTSSGTHHLCAIPFAYVPTFARDLFYIPQNAACVDEQYLKEGMYTATDSAAYIQAKVANVMHAVELPRRHPKATAIAIDLGWVGTAIQPFMQLSFSPTSLGWMRSGKIGILPVLHAILTPSEELVQELRGADGRLSDGIVMNVFGSPEEAFSYNWWNDDARTGRSRMMELSKMLWDVSETVLRKHGQLLTKGSAARVGKI